MFLMHSGGGIAESAAEFPAGVAESPCRRSHFAANMAARHGLDKVLSFDMGGTTAKIYLIKSTPKTARVFEVAHLPLQKRLWHAYFDSVTDMVEIGAGGGLWRIRFSSANQSRA